MIQLPNEVQIILKQLNNTGYSAYIVGGCVRDSLLGIIPGDWDICTSALPEETKQVFSSYHVIETGIQHGTVTVRMNGQSFEITTFRKDGDYKDCRHPEQVQFVSDLEDDLARRDFTVNAMAYHPDRGLLDYFGGKADLEQKVIRCVGDAPTRFSEDALRIMRGLRFAAVYGCSIDADTAAAMHKTKELLRHIAAERLQVELKKLLMSDHCEDILISYNDILSVMIPELAPLVGFVQHNPHHCYDVWTHTVKSLAQAEKDLYVRLTVLFHDIGKPKTFFLDEKGIGHFYSHAEVGGQMCHTILQRLKFDSRTTQAVVELVKYHDAQIPVTEKAVKKWLNRIGPEQFLRLLCVKKADAISTVEGEAKLQEIRQLEAVFQIIKEQNACFSLKDLQVTGKDILALGIKEGTEIGAILTELLELVMDNQLENKRDVLLDYLKKRIKKD